MIRVTAYRKEEKILGGMFDTLLEAIRYAQGISDALNHETDGVVESPYLKQAEVALFHEHPYVLKGKPYRIHIYDTDTFFQDPLEYEQ